MSYRDVEDMLAERVIDVSYETVRRWALEFGAIIARKLDAATAASRHVSIADQANRLELRSARR